MALGHKTTSDPEPDLRKLFDSLQRAGNHWSHGGVVSITDKGYEAIATLADRLPKDALRPVADYIKLFLRELGWKATVSVGDRQVRIALSRA